MDAAHHWPQEFVVKPIDEIVTNAALLCGGAPPPLGGGSHGKASDNGQSQQRKPRPQKEQAVNCPRCNSTNTKFCYYNNYSLTQPRYFCKTCRRYWTEGGSLRNIPVGGGSRKNKRPSSSSSSMSNISNTSNNSASSTSTTTSSASISKIIGQNPSKGTQDLNLAFPPELLHLVPNNNGGNNLERGLLSSFMSMPLNSVADHHQSAVNNYNTTTAPPPPAGHGVFPSFHDIKPTLSFSLDGLGIAGGGSYRNAMSLLPGVPDSAAAGRMFFPFEELKQQQQQQQQVPSSTSIDMEQSNNNNHRGDHQQGSDHNSNGGYWSGMLGGGSW